MPVPKLPEREHLISLQFTRKGASHKSAVFSKRYAFRNGVGGSVCFGWKITNRTFSKKKENEGNFEYLLHFEDRWRNVRQRKRRKPALDEGAPTLTPKMWRSGFLAYYFTAGNSFDCGSTRSRRATSWSTSVFSLDNSLGKSFGHHLPPKEGGKESF